MHPDIVRPSIPRCLLVKVTKFLVGVLKLVVAYYVLDWSNQALILRYLGQSASQQ